MLTIPSAIKTLFQTDGVKKNFRAHFPNGEMPDITNANVVYESVKFTESVCSQDPFKFGLAESSVIEFETVGIANMYGYVIECGIEIDTSSLSSAQIAAIVADPGDGVIVEQDDSDLPYGYYRVPYGIFRVESCPRNHQAMTHRKVTAYSLGRESEYAENPFEIEKLATFLPNGSVYEPFAKTLFASAFGWNDPQFLTGLGYAATDITPVATPTQRIGILTFKRSDNTEVEINLEHYYTTVFRVLDTANLSDPKKGLLAVDTHGVNYDDYLAQFVAFFESVGISATVSGYETLYDAVYDLAKAVYAPCVRYIYFLGGTQYDPLDVVPVPSTNFAIAPYRPDVLCTVNGNYSSGNGMYVNIRIPQSSFTLTARLTNHTVVGTQTYTIGTPASVYRYDDTSGSTLVDSMPIQIFSSGKEKRTIQGKKWNCYAFDGNLDLLAFAKGFLELEAKFAKRDRDGGLSIIGLDNSSPASILPDDTEDLWWDEYSVNPIGTVLYGSPYEIGSGGSIYDMTDNGALKLLPGENISQIKAILLSSFAPNVTDIGFIPAELTMRAMPWIEAGDPIEVTTEDNLTVDSFALRIEINGIQYLKMYCESKGGEIIS